MKEGWNKRYSTEKFAYGKVPNLFFAKHLPGLKAARALFPAEGEGRNAVFAARHGWDVHAFDYSDEAKKKALLLAKEEDVEISYTISSVQEFNSEIKYDLIVLIFVHLPSDIRAEFHKKLAGMLANGGTILLQAFNKQQLGLNSGGPKNMDMLFSEHQLRSDFDILECIHLKETEEKLDEGELHQGKAQLISYIGKK